jgi:hypothetical protein
VAPAGSGLYAIVDGQHRSTAAALLGLDRVPCAVIDVNRAAQAAAFKAINGNVSKLHSVQIYHAALAAGDPEAMRVDAICKKSGVTILRFPTYSGLMKPGETIAYKVIATCTTKFGEDTTVAALKAIAGGGAPLNRGVIFGTSEVLHDHPDWWADDKRLRKAFDTFDLDSIWLEASARAARVKGTSAIALFEAQLIEELEPHFRKGKAA